MQLAWDKLVSLSICSHDTHPFITDDLITHHYLSSKVSVSHKGVKTRAQPLKIF